MFELDALREHMLSSFLVPNGIINRAIQAWGNGHAIPENSSFDMLELHYNNASRTPHKNNLENARSYNREGFSSFGY